MRTYRIESFFLSTKSTFFFILFLFFMVNSLAEAKTPFQRSGSILLSGKTRFSVAPTAYLYTPWKEQSSNSAPIASPSLDVSFAYGLHERVELMIRFDTLADTTVGIGIQLLRSSFFDLAASLDLGLALGGFPNSAPSLFILQTPLQFWGTLKFHRNFYLNLSVGYIMNFRSIKVLGIDLTTVSHSVSPSLSFDIIVNDFLSIRPAVSLVVPFQEPTPTGLIWNAGISFLITFGGGPSSKKRSSFKTYPEPRKQTPSPIDREFYSF